MTNKQIRFELTKQFELITDKANVSDLTALIQFDYETPFNIESLSRTESKIVFDTTCFRTIASIITYLNEYENISIVTDQTTSVVLDFIKQYCVTFGYIPLTWSDCKFLQDFIKRVPCKRSYIFKLITKPVEAITDNTTIEDIEFFDKKLRAIKRDTYYLIGRECNYAKYGKHLIVNVLDNDEIILQLDEHRFVTDKQNTDI